MKKIIKFLFPKIYQSIQQEGVDILVAEELAMNEAAMGENPYSEYDLYEQAYLEEMELNQKQQ